MGDRTPKDLLTRWDMSEITDDEAIGQSIQSLVDLDDRIDANDLKVENLFDEHRKEVFTLKKRLDQQEKIVQAQTDTIRAQDKLLKAQAETIRKQNEDHEAQMKAMETALRVLVDHKFRLVSNKLHSLDMSLSQMIKPNEMAEIVLLELGKMANASQTISKMARQFLDMRPDAS